MRMQSPGPINHYNIANSKNGFTCAIFKLVWEQSSLQSRSDIGLTRREQYAAEHKRTVDYLSAALPANISPQVAARSLCWKSWLLRVSVGQNR